MSSKITSQDAINYEQQYSAHNYHPLPVVFSKAEGANVWDPEGKKYLDFLSAYSAVNQGHCHPKIVQALIDQAQNLTLSSRAFSNDIFGQYAKFVTEYFGYEMMLPMNTGAEAVETAMKLARKWGYLKKGIPENEAIILAATNNFHGRTIAIISMSTDPEARDYYGPFLPQVGPNIPGTDKKLRYNNIPDLEEALKNAGDRVCAFLIEPIQGEAGVVVPDKDYLQKVAALCKKYNVLFICDEIQTGVGRTGKLLCHEHSGVHPDVVLLGKAVAGGLYPVSLVLSSKEIMLTFKPGTHGSTFGGNPLGSAVSMAALKVVRDEKLTERAEVLGQRFRKGLEPLLSTGIVSVIRGMGLLNAIVIDSSKANGRTAWDLCLLLKDRGLLAKPTHDDIIRLSPPLVISEAEIDSGISIIRKAVDDLPTYVAPKQH